MAIEIPPRHEFIYSHLAYPEAEWYWRGIIDPSIFGAGYDLTQGLLGSYPLSTNADDVFGTSNGTAYGGVTFNGSTATFDGVSGSYIGGVTTIPDMTEFTVSVWVEPTGTTSIIFDTGWYVTAEAVAPNILGFVHADGRVYFGVRNGNTVDAGYFNSAPLNEMSNIIFVKTSTEINVYIDEVASTPISTTTNSALNKPMEVGAGKSASNVGGATYPLNGELSNLRVYEDAKGVEAIQALFDEGF